MLLTVNPEVDLGLSRNVSVTQLIANLGSITGGDDAQLDASKDWRLSWWTKIYGYTIDGPYLWVGKGFGVNLATDDGFQVDAEQSLRARTARISRSSPVLACPGSPCGCFSNSPSLLRCSGPRPSRDASRSRCGSLCSGGSSCIGWPHS